MIITDALRHPVQWRAGMAAAALVAASLASGTVAGAPAASAQSSNSVLHIEASPTGPISNNFNPFLSTSPAVLLGASDMVYEPLFQYNFAKPGEMVPWLATSYRFSDGDRTLTFTLRKGVKWSDGTAFTSKDVAFTFDMLKANPALNGLGVTFTSVAAPNPYTVVMHFASPAYVQLYNIAGGTPIVQAHQWSGVKDPATFSDSNPIGTGPYVLQSMNARGITLVRNPHYWQPGEPKVDELSYLVFDSNTSANTALEAGQLDWAGNFVPHIQQLYKQRDPSQRFYEFVPYRTTVIVLNLTRYPFNLLPVRKALSMALNRPAVVNAGEYGEQPAALTPTGLVLPAQDSLLAPEYKDLGYKTDVAGALKLLLKAGFKKGSGGKLLEPDGKPFAFTLIGPTPYTDVMADDQVIAQQWDALGAQVTVSGEAVGSWIDQTDTGNYDVSLTAPGSAEIVDPYGAFNEYLNSDLAAPIGKTSVGDVEHFESPSTDRLLADWASATTSQGRQAALDGIEKVMVQQLPVIPLFYNVYFCEWTTNHFVGWPSPKDPYNVPEPAGSEAEMVVLHLRPVK